MENFDNNFKNLITAPFQNERIEDDNGWSFLENKLRKQNFFTFGYHHFNLYYVLFSVVTISSLVFFYYYKTSLSKDVTNIEVESTHKQIQNNQEYVPYLDYKNKSEENIVYSDSVFIKQTTKETDNSKNISEKPTIKPQKAIKESKITPNIENELNEASNQSNDLSKSKSIESKKTIVIQESFDTIYKIDTQYVNKKSFFKKN